MRLFTLFARFTCFLVFAGSSAVALSAAAGVEDAEVTSSPVPASEYVTCAVYFRMVVGSMSSRYGRDLAALAEVEKDKMNLLMTQARQAIAREYGSELAEEMFQEEWQYALAKLTDEMNRNYEFINRLRYRYDNRCEAFARR